MRRPKSALGSFGVTMIVAGLASVLLLLLLDVRNALPRPAWSINGDAIWGRDFVNLWSAGRIVIERKVAILYDLGAYEAWQDATFGGLVQAHNYSYPPTSLLYAPLFGALPYGLALAIFLSVSAAAFYLAAATWLARVDLPPWWSLALPSTWICLWAGHYGLLLGALWCLAWSLLERKPWRSGVFTGLMIVKPHLAVAMPLLLAKRREWPAISAASATVIFAVIASLALFGSSLWLTYLESTSALQLAIISKTGSYSGLLMPTVASVLRAYGVTRSGALVAQAVVAVVVCLALAWRIPSDPIKTGALGGVATFLILPYAFNYDMTVFGLAALMFLADARAGARRLDAAIAALAIALPALMVFLSLYGVRISPFVVAALFGRMWWQWAYCEHSTNRIESASSSPPPS
jgi:alpha-1,2-mannosyltransferase